MRLALATVLFLSYLSGSATDSGTEVLAARWTTDFTRCAPMTSRTVAGLPASPSMNATPGGTAERAPVDRSSSTTTL